MTNSREQDIALSMDLFGRTDHVTPPPRQHIGHWSMWGSWFCDTCDSPYCELA